MESSAQIPLSAGESLPGYGVFRIPPENLQNKKVKREFQNRTPYPMNFTPFVNILLEFRRQSVEWHLQRPDYSLWPWLINASDLGYGLLWRGIRSLLELFAVLMTMWTWYTGKAFTLILHDVIYNTVWTRCLTTWRSMSLLEARRRKYFWIKCFWMERISACWCPVAIPPQHSEILFCRPKILQLCFKN